MEWMKNNIEWIIALGSVTITFFVSIFSMGRKFGHVETRMKSIETCTRELIEFDVVGRIKAIDTHEKVCQDQTLKEIEETRFDLNSDIEKITIDVREIRSDLKSNEKVLTDVRLYIEHTFGEIKSLIAALPK